MEYLFSCTPALLPAHTSHTSALFIFCVKLCSLLKITVMYQLVSLKPYPQLEVLSGSTSLEAVFELCWLSLTQFLLGRCSTRVGPRRLLGLSPPAEPLLGARLDQTRALWRDPPSTPGALTGVTM
ncbi:unnamed protein product [Rangifer tarandus platyrhynchus]|uniref:Uncharacterized protein n=1 Tax=Rangifer tarandus platyrhynchus TaxID=3082113 RepID=A0AC59Y8J5_RANTA